MNKIKIIINLFMVLIIYESCLSTRYKPTNCDGLNFKEQSLCNKNNDLNKAFSNRNWEYIYAMKLDSEKQGIRDVSTYKSFKSMIDKSFILTKIKIKMCSYKIENNRAETYNQISTKSILTPFLTYTDTVMHVWIYKDENWYLYDWDRSVDFIQIE